MQTEEIQEYEKRAAAAEERLNRLERAIFGKSGERVVNQSYA